MLLGPYEFLIDDPFTQGRHALPGAPATPSAEEAIRAVRAYDIFRADLGWLSPPAARWLGKDAGKTPVGFHRVESTPVSRIISTRIGKIGVVLFPEGLIPGQGPTPEQEASVLAAGRALQEKTVFVLGVSPWGVSGEKKFLPKASGVFACVLGGGEGVGFAQSLSDAPGVLWLRPDGKGRAVNVVEILQIPQKNTPMQWTEDVTFRAALQFLDDSFPSDPAVLKLVGPPPEEDADI